MTAAEFEACLIEAGVPLTVSHRQADELLRGLGLPGMIVRADHQGSWMFRDTLARKMAEVSA